jgi:non-heme chloroperoxidase
MTFSSALVAAMTLIPLPPAPHLEFGEVRLPNGVRLSYAEQGNPRGHAVILLHGYSDSWFSFSPILPLLDPKYHVYALDLRGHGNSDRPREGYTVRDLAGDVLAFMDDQRLARVTVIGHSMGSLVAQQVALRAPERVARLVLINSTARPGASRGLHEIAVAVRGFRDSVPESFIHDFQLSSVYRPVGAEFMSRVIAESRKLPLHAWRGAIEGMLATEPAAALATSRIPALLLWGDRDGVFSREEQRELQQLIGTAELITYPETGHTPHWERPEEVVRDIHAFLARTTSY